MNPATPPTSRRAILLLSMAIGLAAQAQDTASYTAWHPDNNTFEIALPPNWKARPHPSPMDMSWSTNLPDTTCSILMLPRTKLTDDADEFLPGRIRAVLTPIFGQVTAITLTKTTLDNRPAVSPHTTSTVMDAILGVISVHHTIIASQSDNEAILQICSQPEQKPDTAFANTDLAIGPLSASLLYR